jgi:glycosyltransferase involved in cell wall biosynthesis
MGRRFFQNNLSLSLLWPWFFSSIPLVVTRHTWLVHGRSRFSPTVILRKQVCRCARNVAVSSLIASEMPGAAEIIAGPYEDAVFNEAGDAVERNRDYLFVGRLVSDKGADVLVRALAQLRDRGRSFTATIVGDGPQHAAIADLVKVFRLEQSILMPGWLVGPELARCYRSHRVVVVPSRWDEPFGLVVLEALACGCEVVASDAGALGEAAGGNARFFRSGGADSLSRVLEEVALSPSKPDQLRSISLHLERYRSAAVARRYVKLFASELSLKRSI